MPTTTENTPRLDASTEAKLVRANELSKAAQEFEDVQDRLLEAHASIVDIELGDEFGQPFQEVRDGLCKRLDACSVAAAHMQRLILRHRDQLVAIARP